MLSVNLKVSLCTKFGLAKFFNPFLDLRPDCGFQSAKIRYKYRGEPGVNYSIISMITIVDLSSQSKKYSSGLNIS